MRKINQRSRRWHRIVVVFLLILGTIFNPWFFLTSTINDTDTTSSSRANAYMMPGMTIPSTVTWIGDAWILPPSQRMFSPYEIRGYFQHHNVLLIGDSEVSRIHYATLVEVLRGSTNHPSKNRLGNMTLLDGSYKADGSSCAGDSMEHGICTRFLNHSFDFVQLECFGQVSEFLKQNSVGNLYDVVVIATGRLETSVKFQRRQCESATTTASNVETFPGGSFQRMETLIDTLEQLPVPVLWRNGAYSREQQHEFVELMDHKVRGRLLERNSRTSVRLIDYASSVRDRVYARIASERALLFIQLLMNSLSTTTYG
jgi:hypothetical protein